MTDLHLHLSCRHWRKDKDVCSAFDVFAPRGKCVGCPQYEEGKPGLGDAVEKVIAVATLGQAKRIAKRVSGQKDCGCSQRRAALNRAGKAVLDKVKGDNGGN